MIIKKVMTAAAALLTAASLAACGADKEKTESAPSSQTASETPAAPESLSSEAVKELESVPGLSSDSESAEESAEAQTDTDESEPKAEETAAPASVDVGGITLTAEEIPFGSEVKLSDGSNADAVVLGDTMYLLDGRRLLTFGVGDKLEKTGETELSGSYSRVDSDAYGRLYLSRDQFDCALLGEDGELQPLGTAGTLAMSKVMEYGLCSNDGKITKYTSESSDGWTSVAERELKFPENVSSVEFAGNHVLVAHAGGSEITVCDYDGNELADTDGGSVGEDIKAMTETAGVIAASSCGDLCLWNDGGELIGRLTSDDTAKLFGTESPLTIRRLIPGDNGSMLAVCTDDAGKSSECRVFRVSGL